MDGVIILGAGLAGLGCALRLPGARVMEAKRGPGGHARSHELGGVWFDEGAHICHSKDERYRKLIREAAGEVVDIPAAVVRNSWERQWISYPVQNHLRDLPTDLRIRALTDLMRARTTSGGEAPTNYDRWCRGQYGDYLTDTFYRAFTDKYWRTSMEDLATDWLRGRLLPSESDRIIEGAFRAPKEEQAVFATFCYPARGGYMSFYQSLYENVSIHYGERASEIDPKHQKVSFVSGRVEHYQHLASSIPLPELVRITKDVPRALRERAEQLCHTQLVCVNMIVNRPRLTDCHWFYIYDETIDAARVSVPGNLSPGSVPEGQTALQAEVFRRKDESVDSDEIAERALDQLGDLLGFDPKHDVLAMEPKHIRYAYIISDHHRARAVAEICDWMEQRGIMPMGLYGRWKYVWSDAAFRQGEETAERILRSAKAA